MAPFPESESMTIKRLEVALRKKDMQLLKDGAYKLHEKFHTGHRFEFISELEQILKYVQEHDIPQEIKEILCPTIEEILTPDSTNLNIQNNIPQIPQEQAQSAAIETSESAPKGDTIIKDEDIKLQGKAYEEYMASLTQKEPVMFEEEFAKNDTQASSFEEIKPPAPEPKTDNVLLFYDDNSTDINYAEIKNYRNRLNNLFSMQNSEGDYSLLREIAALNNIVDTKIYDIDKIFAMLKTSKSNVSFVTTSQSQELTKILCDKKINFEIPYVQKITQEENSGASFSFIPILGLSNIFVCSHCNLRSLKTDFCTKTLSVQCPNCDSAAFPDLYAINSYNPDCNPVFWHRAFSAFVKSKIWIIINPPLDENKEVIFDFVKTACECCMPDKIYLFSKENDKREFYINMFTKILPDTDIRADFSNIEQLCAVYIREQIRDKQQ